MDVETGDNDDKEEKWKEMDHNVMTQDGEKKKEPNLFSKVKESFALKSKKEDKDKEVHQKQKDSDNETQTIEKNKYEEEEERKMQQISRGIFVAFHVGRKNSKVSNPKSLVMMVKAKITCLRKKPKLYQKYPPQRISNRFQTIQKKRKKQ